MSKKTGRRPGDADRAQGAGEQRGEPVDAAGDAGQALGPVPDGVEAGHDREQHLGGADVAGRLVAADVLLAGLQRHAQGRLAAGVDRDADDPAGHGALVGVPGGEEGGVRAAIAHRHAEALGRAQDDVGTQLARRGEQGQGQQVGGDDGEAALALDRGDRRRAGRGCAPSVPGYWTERAEHGLARRARRPASPTTSSMPRWRARVRRTARVCGWQPASTKKRSDLLRRDAVRHGHGLGGGGGLVEQRGVGQLHAGEVDHHLLVVEQRPRAGPG